MKTISQVPVLKQTQNSFRQVDRIIYHNTMVYNCCPALFDTNGDLYFIANKHFIQNPMLWKILSYNSIFLNVDLVLTIYSKLKW